jgi:hypothetical protein
MWALLKLQVLSVVLFSVIDGVLWNFNHQVLLAQKCLATEARVGLQTPCPIQQVFFSFFGFVQAVQTLAHNDVASGAGTAHIASVLNVNFVIEQGFADAGASRRRNLRAFGAIFSVGQYFDNWHFVI